ncbi:hypothetical protein [Mesoplasma lactucae]|nr:hypothetical protein [Mesoplasma lactucae]
MSDKGFAKGRLTVNGTENTQFLILGVVLAVVWALLTGMVLFYLYKFKKVQAKEKLYGKPMLFTTLGLGLVVLLMWILILAFWSKPESIFKNADKAYSALIAVTVIGFVALAVAVVLLWVKLPDYGIAFTDDEILFLGESIPYNKITKIVKDTKTGNVYVNYLQGKRAHKKQKFSSTSVFGQFVLANAEITGHKVSEEDELKYFKSLANADAKAEKEHDAEVSRKVQEQSSKPKTTKDENKKDNK